MSVEVDPATMPLDELRELRFQLQREDDVVSYARRIAQVRVDLVRAELARRRGDSTATDRAAELTNLLSQHLTGDESRPPRPAVDAEADPLAEELDAICIDCGFSRLDSLDEAELARLDTALSEFERRVSDNRRARYDVLDTLSAELVRRYRDGEANVATLKGS